MWLVAPILDSIRRVLGAVLGDAYLHPGLSLLTGVRSAQATRSSSAPGIQSSDSPLLGWLLHVRLA